MTGRIERGVSLREAERSAQQHTIPHPTRTHETTPFEAAASLCLLAAPHHTITPHNSNTPAAAPWRPRADTQERARLFTRRGSTAARERVSAPRPSLLLPDCSAPSCFPPPCSLPRSLPFPSLHPLLTRRPCLACEKETSPSLAPSIRTPPCKSLLRPAPPSALFPNPPDPLPPFLSPPPCVTCPEGGWRRRARAHGLPPLFLFCCKYCALLSSPSSDIPILQRVVSGIGLGAGAVRCCHSFEHSGGKTKAARRCGGPQVKKLFFSVTNVWVGQASRFGAEAWGQAVSSSINQWGGGPWRAAQEGG